MDRNRIKLIIAMVSGVAVLALGFFLGVQPQLTAASTAAEQKSTVDQQNEGIRAAVEQLIAENEGLSGLEAERDAKLASVPEAPDMPSLIRQLDAMAGQAGTMVTSFTAADPVSYAAPASATAPAAAAASAEGTESSEGTDDSADAAAAAAPADAALPTAPATVTDPSVTAANFSTIAVTVDIQGSYDQALDFVDRLQKGPRLFLVTAITSSEPEEGSETAEGQTWTVGGLVFVMQDGETAPSDGDAATTAPTQAEGADEDTDATAAGR